MLIEFVTKETTKMRICSFLPANVEMQMKSIINIFFQYFNM